MERIRTEPPRDAALDDVDPQERARDDGDQDDGDGGDEGGTLGRDEGGTAEHPDQSRDSSSGSDGRQLGDVTLSRRLEDLPRALRVAQIDEGRVTRGAVRERRGARAALGAGADEVGSHVTVGARLSVRAGC